MEIILNRKVTITILVLLATILFIFNSPFFLKAMYPIHYQSEVHEAADKYKVDPYLVFAIIQIESNFKNERISNKGAKGLMQLMPDTALWIVEQANFPLSTLEKLDTPEENIHIGSWYLAFLEKKFHNNHYAVIAAYNAGPGNVERWLKDNTWDGTYEHIGNIPYGETRHYVQRVLYFYNKYREIYS